MTAAEARRPTALTVNPDGIPAELKAVPHWVLWRWENRDGRWTKPPSQPNGAKADPTQSRTWSSFDDALWAYQRGGFDGIGFVLTSDDDLVAVDFDHCIENNRVVPWAQEAATKLGTYTETSPSATGLRLFLRGKLPSGGRKKGDVEMYDRARYVTVSGAHVSVTPRTIERRQAEIQALHEKVFGKVSISAETAPTNLKLPLALSESDEELLKKARAAKNGAGQRFAALFDQGDWQGQGFPSQSEADLVLASSLLYWVDADQGRADRLFRASALMRDKWDALHGKQTYGESTLSKARAELNKTRSSAKKEHTGRGGGEPTSPDSSEVVKHPTSMNPNKKDTVIDSNSFKSITMNRNGANEPKCGTFIDPFDPTLSVPEIQFVVGAPFNFPVGYVSVVAAEAGVGKTNLAACLASSCVLGKPFIGAEVQQGRVLYVDCDGGAAMVLPALHKAARGLGMDPSALRGLVDYMDLSDGTLTGTLSDLLPELQMRMTAQGTRLLIVDAFQSAYSTINENNGNEVKPIMAALIALARRTGAAVVVLDHVTSKGLQPGQKATPMGSNAKMANARTVFIIGKVDQGTGALQSNTLQFDCIKCSFAPTPPRFGVLREWQEDSVSYHPANLPEAAGTPKTTKINQAAYHLLYANQHRVVTRKELLNTVLHTSGASESQVKRVLFDERLGYIETMLRKGTLRAISLGGKGNPIGYQLADLGSSEK